MVNHQLIALNSHAKRLAQWIAFPLGSAIQMQYVIKLTLNSLPLSIILLQFQNLLHHLTSTFHKLTQSLRLLILHIRQKGTSIILRALITEIIKTHHLALSLLILHLIKCLITRILHHIPLNLANIDVVLC